MSKRKRATRRPAEDEPMDTSTAAARLAAALAVGLIVGLERGWRDRGLAEGARVAGLRTFALLGLLGGVLALLQPLLGAGPLVAGIVAVGGAFAVAYAITLRETGSRSLTSLVAALLTLVLGALAALGQTVAAVGCAVLTAVLLDLKPVLHRWLRLVEAHELRAALQLGVLSAVVWPLLPDTGMGPYGALNPYRLWLAVVLVAGLSLAGHFAMRLAGPRDGVVLTGLLGGLASSTAVTVALARRSREQPGAASNLAAGVLLSCGVMFVRIGILLAALQPVLLSAMAWPLGAMAAIAFAAGGWLWRSARSGEADSRPSPVEARYDLMTALSFAALMAAVSVLTQALRDGWGDAGLYALSALSGLADVDAMTVSIARLHALEGVATGVASNALLLVMASNLLSKGLLAWGVGGRALGWRVVAGFAATVAGGAVALGASGG